MITDIFTAHAFSIAPGSNQTLFFNVPASVNGYLSAVLSTVVTTDPMESQYFNLLQVLDEGFAANHSWGNYAVGAYYGARLMGVVYTSTASGDIDVNISLVFTDSEDPNPIQYVAGV